MKTLDEGVFFIRPERSNERQRTRWVGTQSTLAPDAHLPWRAVPGSAGVCVQNKALALLPIKSIDEIIVQENSEKKKPQR